MDDFLAHILVVDDDDGIRSLVKKYLNENEYLITTADSAEDEFKVALKQEIGQGLTDVKREKDKVVIIDFGSQVTKLIARRIRELGVYSEILTPRNIYKLKKE